MQLKNILLGLGLSLTATWGFPGNARIDRAQTRHTESTLFSTGQWTGHFLLDNGLRIPFQFEIKPGREKETELYFINADERFRSGNLVKQGDSLRASLEPFDNEIIFHIKGDSLAGFVRRQDGRGQPLKISARPGKTDRFITGTTTAKNDVSGTYEVRFGSRSGKQDPSVGLFTQQGSELKASFLRITGDSRYLQGVVVNDSFHLSSFIGSSPVYYRGQITTDGKLSGEVIGSRGSGQPFEGELNEDASLPDAFSLTYLRDGYNRFDFSFPDIEGKTVSLSDERFRDKVVVVSIGGTWCPNCLDEAVFLSDWYKKNKKRGVEVVGVQYERDVDPDYLRRAITRFRSKFGIEYTQVVGGLADKSAVAASFPSLNTFLSFPTTIFIDKNGKVVRIHTGFSGPATGKYYEDFVNEFDHIVDSLLKG